MTTNRVRKSNVAVEALLRHALDESGLSIEDLGERTGLDRNAGALVRGEVQRISPEQAEALVRALPITLEQLLRAYGFPVGVSPQREIPREIAELYLSLPPKVRTGMVELMQRAASLATPGAGSAA